ncbi:hypothetical protein SFR_4593 [Streptomyces sp. FR-008]|nr:hypothetical protein SFR_4593 [Streptomyces sp. FR-008]
MVGVVGVVEVLGAVGVFSVVMVVVSPFLLVCGGSRASGAACCRA